MSEPQQPSVPPYGQPNPYVAQPPAGQPQPAQQPYQQQPYPAATPGYTQNPAPYGQQAFVGAPQTYPGAAPSRPVSSANLGRTALIIALVGFGLGLLRSMMYPLMYPLIGHGPIWFTTMIDFVLLLVAVAALVVGLIAVRRPGPKVLAGIAIGIAAAQIASIVISGISNTFYYFI